MLDKVRDARKTKKKERKMGNKTYRNKSQITKINVFTFILCIWENLYLFQKLVFVSLHSQYSFLVFQDI